jgi:hypothetical protein
LTLYDGTDDYTVVTEQLIAVVAAGVAAASSLTCLCVDFPISSSDPQQAAVAVDGWNGWQPAVSAGNAAASG